MTLFEKHIKEISNLDFLPYDKLSDKNILITGATGLIGSTLIKVLLYNKNKRINIYACGRNYIRANQIFKEYITDSRYHFIEHDITAPLNINIKFDFIIHAASGASPSEFVNNPVEVIKANVLGVSNLLDYSIKTGVERFLYVSSGEVYGESNLEEIYEDNSGYVNTMNFRSCYPSSKRAAESLCVSYSEEYNIDTVIVRPSHTFGPQFTENDNRAYAQFIRNVINNQDIILKSDGSQMRSWCYVVDCVSAILYVLLCGENKNAYNIADINMALTIKELADSIAQVYNKKIKFEIPDNQEVKGYNPVKCSIFNTDKLQNLGWSPLPYTIQEKIKATVEYAKLLHT